MNNQDSPKVVRIEPPGPEAIWPGARSRVMLLGVLLIVLGVLLGAGQLFHEAQVGASGFFLVLGLVLVVVGIRDRSDLALYVGLFVSALSLSDLLGSAGLIHGSGWGPLFLGLGVVAVALVRSSAGKRWTWPLGIGALLALWGGSEVLSSNVKDFPSDRLIGPLLIVLLGLYILARTRR